MSWGREHGGAEKLCREAASVSYLWGGESRGGQCSTRKKRGSPRAEVGCGDRCLPHLGKEGAQFFMTKLGLLR